MPSKRITREQNIDFGFSSLARTHSLLDRMDHLTGPGDCCPGCLFGARYTKATDRAQRQTTWLIHLLLKAGRTDEARILSRTEDCPTRLRSLVQDRARERS